MCPSADHSDNKEANVATTTRRDDLARDKERTLQRETFGRNQRAQPIEPAEALYRTRLLSPAEIWRS